MSVKKQLTELRRQLSAGVTLVAVSKTHPADAIQEAYEAGQRIFGESRPQELKAKAEALPQDIEWHMIGHLQTNKVRMLMPYVTCIQSLDSRRLAECIEAEAARAGRTVDVLLEIRVAQEESKSGWEPAELEEYVAGGDWRSLTHLRFCGVMGIASNTDDEAVVRRDFELLASYRQRFAAVFGEQFSTLSMGMSHDFKLAVDCGSTMVRVGSLIFGERDYGTK